MSWAKPAPRVRQWDGPMPTPRSKVQPVHIPDGKDRAIISLPKNPPKRDEAYRRWVATLACAHADEGKGMAMKADDDTCFPLCPHCHEGIGSLGWFKKEHRRHLEVTYGARTRLQALAEGTFPKGWM